MAKGKKNGNGSGDEVLSLKLDAKTKEPVEVSPSNAFETPCSITGVGAGFSGGMLGWVFGFGGYWMRNRLKGQLKAALTESWNSAKTFAIMGGLYAAVTCFAKRIRQKEDGWNGAAAGCATGLALGWNGSPTSALQSCALFGIFSYFIDNMSAGSAHALPAVSLPTACTAAQPLPLASGVDSDLSGYSLAREALGRDAPNGAAEPAASAIADRSLGGSGQQAGLHPQHGQQTSQHAQQWLEDVWAQLAQPGAAAQQAQRSREAVRQLLAPALPLLGALAPCQFGERAGVAGCRVVRRH